MATTRSGSAALGASTVSEPLGPDDLFHSLQNERRRRVLRALEEAPEETFAMGDLAEAVAAAENECPERQVSSTQRKRVYVALYQHHLPQLDDVGLVEYDQDRGRVRAGPALGQARKYLEMTAVADAAERPSESVDSGVRGDEDDGNDDLVLGAVGGVAGVGLLATGAVWGGVLGASSALVSVLTAAMVAFVVSVALCR